MLKKKTIDFVWFEFLGITTRYVASRGSKTTLGNFAFLVECSNKKMGVVGLKRKLLWNKKCNNRKNCVDSFAAIFAHDLIETDSIFSVFFSFLRIARVARACVTHPTLWKVHFLYYLLIIKIITVIFSTIIVTFYFLLLLYSFTKN